MRFGEFAVHVDRLFVKPESQIGKMLHAAVGISGEVGEIEECLSRFDNGEGFDHANMIEECGDSWFYAQGFCANTGLDLGSMVVLDAKTDNLNLSSRVSTIAASKLLDLVKKTWIYGKDFDNAKAAKYLSMLLHEIAAMGNYCGLTVFQVFDENFKKLSIRYPSGYTDQAAQLRADKAGGSQDV